MKEYRNNFIEEHTFANNTKGYYVYRNKNDQYPVNHFDNFERAQTYIDTMINNGKFKEVK